MKILVILAIQLIAIFFDNCDAHWIPDDENVKDEFLSSNDDLETIEVKRVLIERKEEFEEDVEEILLPKALEELSAKKLSIDQGKIEFLRKQLEN